MQRGPKVDVCPLSVQTFGGTVPKVSVASGCIKQNWNASRRHPAYISYWASSDKLLSDCGRGQGDHSGGGGGVTA